MDIYIDNKVERHKNHIPAHGDIVKGSGGDTLFLFIEFSDNKAVALNLNNKMRPNSVVLPKDVMVSRYEVVCKSSGYSVDFKLEDD